MAGCAKDRGSSEVPDDRWNGYHKYLKTGEVIHTLWAGQHIDVGTVTYGIDNDANFYVTYDCSSSGWVISESHMFCGDKVNMPVNKPGKPKIGKFPNKADHSPSVSTYTYTVPLIDLPPAEDPGFVVATHCVVHSPSGQEETAWGEGDYTFSDKGWGWYDVYYFNQPDNPYTILYGTEYTTDSLRVYRIDVTNGITDLILVEYVGNNNGSYDATAYDLESGNLLFVNYNTQELYVNNLTDEGASVSTGTLTGTASSATFHDGSYYYVDGNTNEIMQVSFDSNWNITTDVVISTIPGSVTITDIAMNLDGTEMYMVGNVGNGTTEMIVWDVQADTYSTIALTLAENTQIAYATDGKLYAVSPEGNGESSTHTIDTNTGVSEEINIGTPIGIDPIKDISKGPVY
jgi:hypothetical protein